MVEFKSKTIKEDVEKMIKRAERRKDMQPLRKEYKGLIEKLYAIYKQLPENKWPKDKRGPKGKKGRQEITEEVETMAEAEAVELIAEPKLEVDRGTARRRGLLR